MPVNSFLQKQKQQEILDRVAKLNPSSHAQWGQMNCIQMLEHCAKVQQIYLREIEGSKPNFLLKMIGYIFKKLNTNSNKPYSKNAPTDKKFLEFNHQQFHQAQEFLIQKLKLYFIGLEKQTLFLDHPFFGKMTFQECAILSYKHLDHHLRQFQV